MPCRIRKVSDPFAGIGHQMRPAGDRDEGLARLQPDLLLGILQEEPHLAFQHIEGVGDVGVEVPRHGLRRRELQLADAEAGTFGVAGAALDLVEVAGVLDWLECVSWLS